MKVDDFDYHLPRRAIAQFPLKDRVSARLLFLRSDNKIEHYRFSDLPELLKPGDLLVFNDSKVIRARIRGKKKTGGKAELLLIEKNQEGLWRCLGRGRIQEGMEISIGDLVGRVEKRDGHNLLVLFNRDPLPYGEIPLPPYIKRRPEPGDEIYYQNVFARKDGSVAAATAGLHFTDRLLDRLKVKGIDNTMITCHIRPGIFQHVKDLHFKMEGEPFEVTQEAADKIRDAGRIIAVGTSVVRVLEGFGPNSVTAQSGMVKIVIKPAFRFQKISGMITNFHLPKSPPFIMVSALVGVERLKEVYQIAIAQDYRFLSYGDGMLIIRDLDCVW